MNASDEDNSSSTTSATSEFVDVLDVNSNNADGVGLSNPRLSQSRRRMLDLVNKLHSTGSVLSSQPFLVD